MAPESDQPTSAQPEQRPEINPEVWVADVTREYRSFLDLGWLGTIVTLGMASVLLVITVGELATAASTLAGEHATAVVANYREQRSRGGSVTYRPVFKFTTTKGQVVEVTSHTGWGWKGPRIGENIPVAYPAAQPTEAEIVGLGLFINSMFFGLFACLLLVLGLTSLRLGYRRRRIAGDASS